MIKRKDDEPVVGNTFYEFYFPEHDRTVKIDVPFSLEEITILQDARNLRALLKDEMLKSSGWQTEAYLISVPWGYVLKGRKSSLEQLNRLKSLMIQIQDPRFKNHSDTDIAQRPQDFSEKMLDLINQII